MNRTCGAGPRPADRGATVRECVKGMRPIVAHASKRAGRSRRCARSNNACCVDTHVDISLTRDNLGALSGLRRDPCDSA
jgi:hypothetical protein